MSTNTSNPGAWSEPHSNFSGQGCHEYSFRGRGQYGPGMVNPRAAGEKVDGWVSMQTASRMPRRDQLLSSMSSTMSSRGHGPPLIQPETMTKRPTSSQWWMGRTTLVPPVRLPLKRPLRLTCVRPADGSRVCCLLSQVGLQPTSPRKAYISAGHKTSALLTMAILQVFQTRLLKSLDEEVPDLESFRKLCTAVDLALGVRRSMCCSRSQNCVT